PEDNLDFAFLSAQDISFPVKIFVRREFFWGATKTFAGTDYDFNDWAAALNTARFSEVRLLAGGFHEPASIREKPSVEESQRVKSKINAKMWWTERVRQAVRLRFIHASDRFA